MTAQGAAEVQAATRLLGLLGPPRTQNAASRSSNPLLLTVASLMCHYGFWLLVSQGVDGLLVLSVNAKRGRSNGMPNNIKGSLSLQKFYLTG